MARWFNNFDDCSSCKKYLLIVNKKYNLCYTCNKARLEKNKKKFLQGTDYDYLYSKSVRAQMEKEKQKDSDFYNRIWEEEKYHHCRYCDERIYGMWLPYNMDHILPKSKFPSLRHRKRNIAFTDLTCHGIKTSEKYTNRMISVILDTAEYFIKEGSLIQIGKPNVYRLKDYIIERNKTWKHTS
jgi:DNA-directed RNA polymerase subunit RPC12/RpoP